MSGAAKSLESLDVADPALPGDAPETPPQGLAPRAGALTVAFWKGRGGLALVSLSLILGGWWGVTAAGWIAPLFLPSPGDVVRQLIKASTVGYMDATLLEHAKASVTRIVLAAAAAAAVGIPIGLLMGTNRTVRGLLDPLIEIYRPIPPLAYLPLIVIWFGIGETSKVLVIFLAILAPIVVSTAHGTGNAGSDRIRAAQSLGATRWQLLRHVVLPGALPDILTGLRIGLGAGWSTLVAAELVAATQGLGFMVQSASQFLATDVVIAGILVIAAIAFSVELVLRAVQRRLSPWHGLSD